MQPCLCLLWGKLLVPCTWCRVQPGMLLQVVPALGEG